MTQPVAIHVEDFRPYPLRVELVADTRQAVEVPATMQPQLAWVLERDRFVKSELASAFPDQGADKLDRLIADLSRMALLEPA